MTGSSRVVLIGHIGPRRGQVPETSQASLVASSVNLRPPRDGLETLPEVYETSASATRLVKTAPPPPLVFAPDAPEAVTHLSGTFSTNGVGPVLGVLLAAGAGRRYGAPKVLAEGGRWLRAGVTCLAEGGCDEVVVVLGAAQVAVPSPARAVVNAEWDQGMGSSVRCGIAEARRRKASLVILHLVDLPDVPAAAVTRVLEAARSAGLARATYDGVPGHPVALDPAHWADLEGASTGDRGGRTWLADHPGLILVPCGDLASGRDRDTRTVDG